MNTFMFAYAALLFIVLTPGVLLRLPMNGSKMTVALTHGLVFAVVWHFTHKMVWRASYEGFQAAPITPGSMATPPVVMATQRVTQALAAVATAQQDVTEAQRSVQLANQGLVNVKRILENKKKELKDAQRAVQLAEQARRGSGSAKVQNLR